MNILDYVLLAGLVGFGVFGFIKGFFKQALVIVGLVVAFFLASRYHTTVAEMSFLRSVRERSEDVALVGSFLGILFVVAAVGSIIATLVGRRVQSLSIGAVDRWLGAFLGIIVGAVLLGGVALGLKQLVGGGAVANAEGVDGIVASSVMVKELSEVCLTVMALAEQALPEAQRDELSQEYEEWFKSGGMEGDTSVSPDSVKSSDPPPPSPLLGLGARRQLLRKFTEESTPPVPAAAESVENSDAVPAVTSESE